MIHIDRDIPNPHANVPTRFPWREMEVGDSFLVPARGTRKGIKHILAGANKLFAPRAFESWSIPDGVRVWRTK